jgi:2-polyprenyl-3-methyl-5-hydroxy-6-metoxy-1,4-benzoquinol methylase
MTYSPLISTITRVYESLIVRLYVTIRFRIINTKILDTIMNYFKPEGELLVIGCGFGLFDLLAGLRWPEKRIYGVDLSEKRIGMARQAALKLGLRNNTFDVADVAEKDTEFGRFDEILMLDVLHHVPISEHQRLIDRCYEILRPGGCLVLKDIHRENRPKLFFTWILDMVMTNWEPVYYRSEQDVRGMVEASGFDHMISIYINDLLPYPHIQYVCFKSASE